MSYATIAFALAIAAVLAVVIVLFLLQNLSRMFSRDNLELRAKLLACENGISRTNNASLAAEVAALDAALAKLAKSVRSQFGSVWGTIGALEDTTAAAEPANNGERPTREQLRALYLKPPQAAKE